MRTFLLPLLLHALVGAAATLPAQSPCSQNLVANGDFESFFPLWTKAGPVQTTFVTANVNGVEPSRSWQLWGAGGAYTLNAPAPLVLAAGTYEFSLDVFRDHGWGTTVNIGITTGGTRTGIATWGFPGTAGKSRIAFLFTVATAGSYALDIQVATDVRETLRLDNAAVHPAVLPFLNVDQHSRRVAINNSFVVLANPNDFVAVCVGLAPLVPELAIPTCSGTLQIGPLGTLVTAVPLTSCNTAGELRGTIAIPAALAGIPLHWQAVLFAPACEIGCADLIAF
jgi:hypothetical protein